MNFFFYSFALILLSTINACSHIGEQKHLKFDPFFIKWSKNFDPTYQAGNIPIALNSPLIVDDILYTGDHTGKFKAFKLENGQLIWEVEERDQFSSIPFYFEGMIFYGTNNGKIYARDSKNGHLIFERDLGSGLDSEFSESRGRLFLQTRNHKLFSLDIKTGKILWTYKRSVPYPITIQGASSPLIDNNIVYNGFADGNLVAFSLDDGSILWEKQLVYHKKFIDVDMSPVIRGNKLYVAALGGMLHILDKRTGILLRKIETILPSGKLLYHLSTETFFVASSTGEILQVDQDGEILKRKKISTKKLTTLHFWEGSLVVSSLDGHLYKLNLRTLEKEGQFYFGTSYSYVYGKIAGHKKFLAVQSSRNRLYVFKKFK